MNIHRRKRCAELAAELHPLLQHARVLAAQEQQAAAAKPSKDSIVIQAPEQYLAVDELTAVAATLEQCIDVLIKLPTIGAAR